MRQKPFAAALAVLSLALLPAGCARTPAQREAHFLERGKAFLARKDYARANLEFRSAAQAMPRDAEPYYQLALVYLELKDVRSAIKCLKTAVALNPKHSAAQLKLAAFELGSTNDATLGDARKRLDSVLNANPNDPEALEMRAIEDLRLGKFEDAARDFQRSLAKAPGNLQASYNLAKLKLFQNDAGGAEAVLKEAVRNAPRSPEAALALASFYRAVAKRPEAEAQIRRALDLDPRNGTAWLMLAAVQMEAGHTAEAEQTYRRIAALPDKAMRPLHAVFLFQQGRQEEAIAELSRLAKADPADRHLRALLVSAYISTGRAGDARRVLDEAVRRNAKDTDALLDRSGFEMASGQAAQAEADLRQVLRYQPQSAEAHYGLAKVYAARGAAALENQELGEALRLRPDLLAARTDLARLLLRTKEASAAMELLDQAPKPQKLAPAYIATRNWILMAAGNRTELRKSIDQGLAIAKTPELRYQDALLRLNQKDYRGARPVLEELLTQYPESTSSLDLLAQSYALQGSPDKALEVVRAYAGKQPKSAYLRYLVGVWETKAHHPAQARQAFQEAVNENPDFLPPALLLAEMQLTDGSLGEARRTLNEVLTRHPRNLRAQFLLGLVEEKSGNRDAAIHLYRAVVAADPSNADALNNLAYNLIADRPDEALKYAQSALELSPDSAAAQDTLGWIYYQKGIYRSALDYLKRAVQTEPTAVRELHLGLTYARLGDQDLARQNLTAAIKKDPRLAAMAALAK